MGVSQQGQESIALFIDSLSELNGCQPAGAGEHSALLCLWCLSG